MDTDALRLLIRQKLQDGLLAFDSVSQVSGAPADCEVPCDMCDNPITRQQLVLEGIASLSEKKPKLIHFHVRCVELWTDEKRQLDQRTA